MVEVGHRRARQAPERCGVTYLTPADLAEEFRTDVPTILRWRLAHSWPSMKFGKQIRFTPEHVEQIKALHEAKAEAATPTDAVIAGQTERSKARSA